MIDTPHIDLQQLSLARAALKLQLPSVMNDEGKDPMTYFMLEGYLFSVCCAPLMVMPSQWMSALWGDGGSPFKEMEEVEAFMQHLMVLYNHINYCVREECVSDACTVTFVEPALENTLPQAPAAQWVHGFMIGDLMNQDMWAEVLERSVLTEDGTKDVLLATEITALLVPFMDPEGLEELLKQPEALVTTREGLIELCMEGFSTVLENYAGAALYIQEELLIAEELLEDFEGE